MFGLTARESVTSAKQFEETPTRHVTTINTSRYIGISPRSEIESRRMVHAEKTVQPIIVVHGGCYNALARYRRFSAGGLPLERSGKDLIEPRRIRFASMAQQAAFSYIVFSTDYLND